MELPLISICCITYNHVKYIKQAIESFLMQKTSFKYEIIIHDDASTDGTTEIVEEYKIKYPELINTIIQTENQYSKGVSISANYVWTKAKGKYIALCEGDDFWTDPNKLQKQVDILEKDDSVELVHTDYSVLYNVSKKKINSYYSANKKEIAEGDSFEKLLRSWGIKIATVCVRKELLLNAAQSDTVKSLGRAFDLTILPELAKHTEFAFIDEVTATYRVLENSESNYKDVDKFFIRAKRNFEIKSFFIEKYDASDFTKKIILKEYLMRSFIFAIKNNKPDYQEQFYSKLKDNNLVNYKIGIINILGKYKGVNWIIKLLLKVLY